MSNLKEYIAPEFKNLYLVGVGGTGGYLAQGLAKLIAGYRLDVALTLIDPDQVEEKNLHRQNFLGHEVGVPKAEALAFRLNQQYGLTIGHHVEKGETLLAGVFRHEALLITCVDRVAPRKKLAKLKLPWLDLGNDVEYGQAIYGDLDTKKACEAVIEKWDQAPFVAGLPNPAVKVGLASLTDKKKTPSCADQPFAEQSCFVNELAAQAGLSILHQLLVKGRVTTPAIYFDTGKGRMAPAKITKDYFTF